MVSAFKPVLPMMPERKRPNNGGAAARQQRDNSPGVFLAGTAPGSPPMVFQPGEAIKIPAGSVLTFQMHYTANGKGAEDQTSLGLIFAKEPPVAGNSGERFPESDAATSSGIAGYGD